MQFNTKEPLSALEPVFIQCSKWGCISSCHNASILLLSHYDKLSFPADFFYSRGAFSYVKRVTQKASKMEYAAKFISTRAKKKASALREMNLLSKLDNERIFFFHDAFEKKNAVIIITELYPYCASNTQSTLMQST